MNVQVIGFDLFGTLLDATAEVNICLENICTQLQLNNIPISREEFTQTYRNVTRSYQTIRHEAYKEVNNAFWIQNTLRRLGYDLDVTNHLIQDAVNAYFSPWVFNIYEDVHPMLQDLVGEYPLGIISNFTHAPFIRETLHRFNLHTYFKTIIVSDEIGWRKPHPQIFKHFLKAMRVNAEKVLFIGDNLECDIKGANDIGMNTAWLCRIPPQAHNHDATTEYGLLIRSLSDLRTILL